MVTDQKGHSSRHSDGGSDELDAADLAGSSGTSGQFLQTDGSVASWTDLESETVNTISSDYTTQGETTILLGETEFSSDPTVLNSLTLTGKDFPVTLKFYSSGSKMLLYNQDDNIIYEFSLTTAYDISTASTTGNTFDMSTEGNIGGLTFSSDGTEMIATNGDNNSLEKYSLSTGFDITTASYTGNTFDTSTEGEFIRGVASNSNGTTLYVSWYDRTVNEYALSTGFDLTTASYTGTEFDFSATLSDMNGDMTFANNGDNILFNDGSNIFIYDLPTAYDLANNSLSKTIDVSSEAGNTRFGDIVNGKLYVSDAGNDAIYSYEKKLGIPNTITLSSSDTSSGKIVRVVDTTGSAGSNSVTINSEGSELINGESSAVLNSDFEGLTFQSDGSDWYIVSRMNGGSI